MFERYTAQARRVIFFARYEASNCGSPHIDTEHRGNAAGEAIHMRVEAYADPDKRQNISPAVDVPISHSSLQALAHAAKEADRLQSEQIDCLHLALGILRDEKCFGAILLREQGVNASAIEKNI